LKVQNKTSKFYIPQFKLDSGELLENVEIAYTTYGTLSEKGDNAVLKNRELMGATDPTKAENGTLRKMYGISIDKNSVHGSDSVDNGKLEIKFFFK